MDIEGLEFTEEQALWRGGAPGEAGPEKGRSCGGRGPRVQMADYRILQSF